MNVLNSTALYLAWSAPPFEDRNGVITGYTVNITLLAFSSLSTRTTVAAGIVSLTVNNLSPFSVYTVTIAVINTAGLGPFSPAISVLTDEDCK